MHREYDGYKFIPVIAGTVIVVLMYSVMIAFFSGRCLRSPNGKYTLLNAPGTLELSSSRRNEGPFQGQCLVGIMARLNPGFLLCIFANRAPSLRCLCWSLQLVIQEADAPNGSFPK